VTTEACEDIIPEELGKMLDFRIERSDEASLRLKHVDELVIDNAHKALGFQWQRRAMENMMVR